MSGVLSLLLTLAVFGLIAYVIQRFIPMESSFSAGFRILCGIIVILIIASYFFGGPGFSRPVIHW